MIKTIIFDLGGVLIDVDLNKCFENLEALGVDMNQFAATDDDEDGSTVCEGVKASGIFNLYQKGLIPTREFMEDLQSKCATGTTYQQVIDAWNSCLLELPQYKLDFIKSLKTEGYTIHLLSNTNDEHWRFIEKERFQEPASNYFTHLFLSQEMHLAKPDTEIYREVLRQIDSPADECLFIDDSSVNCNAAESLGIHTFNAPILTDYRKEILSILDFYK